MLRGGGIVFIGNGEEICRSMRSLMGVILTPRKTSFERFVCLSSSKIGVRARSPLAIGASLVRPEIRNVFAEVCRSLGRLLKLRPDTGTRLDPGRVIGRLLLRPISDSLENSITSLLCRACIM